jgi:hypothetical protein
MPKRTRFYSLFRQLLIFVFIFFRFGIADSSQKCESLIFIPETKLNLPYNLVSNSEVLIEISEGAYSYYIIKGSLLHESNQARTLYEDFILKIIPDFYLNQMHLDEAFVAKIQESSLKFINQSTLILAIENQTNKTPKILGGVAYYFSQSNLKGLPLFSELPKDERLKLPDLDDHLVEIGRVLMLNNDLPEFKSKRDIFLHIHALGKILLSKQIQKYPNSRIVSITSSPHIRFYTHNIGIHFHNLVPINTEENGSRFPQFFNEIDWSSLPDWSSNSTLDSK